MLELLDGTHPIFITDPEHKRGKADFGLMVKCIEASSTLLKSRGTPVSKKPTSTAISR